MKKVFGNDKHLGCFDHTLNLTPKAALGYKKVQNENIPNVEGIPELIDKVKKIVGFSHRSYNFANELKRIQMEMGKSEGTALRLCQDVITRWGSTYLMLERFLDLREVVTLAALKFPEVDVLTASQFATLRVIRDILKPFHQATTEMSAEKTTTASKVIPIITLVRKVCFNLAHACKGSSIYSIIILFSWRII